MGQWLKAFTVLSKHQLSGSELFVTLIPEDLITLTSLDIISICVTYTNKQTNSHTSKTN